MEKAEVLTLELTIEPGTWCDEAARLLATTIRGAPCYSIEDLERELEVNPDCKLYRVAKRDGGELVGFVVLRLERYAGGAEGVLVAAAGRLAGANLYAQILPSLERMFTGVKSFRVEACRSAAVVQLMKAGYLPTHFVMRRAADQVQPARFELAGDDLLEDLQSCNHEARGGPDLRARPGKLHGGGGSSSSSSSNSSTQNTTNVDRRQVVDSSSVGVSSDTSTVTVNVLDQGAIARAGDIAKQAIDSITTANGNQNANLSNVLGFAKDVFTTGIGVLDKAGQQVQAQTDLVAKAYDTAQGAGDQKNLVAGAALAVVAVVAIKIWGHK